MSVLKYIDADGSYAKARNILTLRYQYVCLKFDVFIIKKIIVLQRELVEILELSAPPLLKTSNALDNITLRFW